MPRTIAVMAVLALFTQATLTPIASSADISRAEYVEESEPICKANTVANRSILRGARDDIRQGRLKRAGWKFHRAARALDRTIRRLERLPQPSPDVAILARWFGQLKKEARLLDRVAKQLKANKKAGLGRYILRMRHTANKANNIVLTFGFEYCLLQPARYL